MATEPDGRVVAFLALSDDMIDQLYVTPDRIGTGIGSRLIATAKARRPDGLDLYCFQVNTRARTFYEHHGFVVDRHRRRVRTTRRASRTSATRGDRIGEPAQSSGT